MKQAKECIMIYHNPDDYDYAIIDATWTIGLRDNDGSWRWRISINDFSYAYSFVNYVNTIISQFDGRGCA